MPKPIMQGGQRLPNHALLLTRWFPVWQGLEEEKLAITQRHGLYNCTEFEPQQSQIFKKETNFRSHLFACLFLDLNPGFPNSITQCI